MTALTLSILLTFPAAEPVPAGAAPVVPTAQPAAPETSRPVGMTRDEEKALLEKYKKAKPRLPMPPADPDNPLGRVNNGAFRAYYLPAELRESRGTGPRGTRESDPAMTLDNTFKVKLFWIASRANNCFY